MACGAFQGARVMRVCGVPSATAACARMALEAASGRLGWNSAPERLWRGSAYFMPGSGAES